MNCGRFQQLKQYFFSWREIIRDLITQIMATLPSFNELPIKVKGEQSKPEPVVETLVVEEVAHKDLEVIAQIEALPAFDSLVVKSESDSITDAIDKQDVSAPQYSQAHRAAWPFPTISQPDNGVEIGDPTVVRKKNPRPKLAKSITEFRTQAGKGHALFYRYLRIPDEANSYEPGPKGGACILVDMLDSDRFVFSFAVCSPVDPFIKDEARRLCQERYSNNDTCTVSNRDDFYTCFENVGFAIRNYFEGIVENGEPRLHINSPRVTENQLKLLLKAIDSWSPVGA